MGITKDKSINIRLDDEVKEEFDALCDREMRKNGTAGRILLEWAMPHWRKAGSLMNLMRAEINLTHINDGLQSSALQESAESREIKGRVKPKQRGVLIRRAARFFRFNPTPSLGYGVSVGASACHAAMSALSH